MRHSLLIVLLLPLAACTAGRDSIGIRPDPASVTQIGLEVDFEPARKWESGERLQGIAATAAKNLQGWGFPVDADARSATHIMAARVGRIEHKGTPPGFSFSVGDSDPRGADFQKADVLPITCKLYPADKPSATANMYMDFIVRDLLKSAETASSLGSEAAEAYSSHIATLCFNLMTELKIRPLKKAEASSTSSQPSWVPEVRIEVRDAPEPAQKAPSSPLAPAKKTAPAIGKPVEATPATSEPATPATPAETIPAEPKPEESNPVKTETRSGEGRKQVIIHNQGAPVILEFGYERK